MTILHLLAGAGVSPALSALTTESQTGLYRPLLEDHFVEHGVSNPSDIVDDLIDRNILARYGQRIGLSGFGKRALLLIDAIEGADIDNIFRRLLKLENRDAPYALVREGMTNILFKSLLNRPVFGRLYVCSPWLHLTERQTAILRYSVLWTEKAHGRRPELFVLTRPPGEVPPEVRDGVRPFEEVGAEIFLHSRLHSKLYVREPNKQGIGPTLAVVGSQNLTRSHHLELGIHISGDTLMIQQLIRYFFDIANSPRTEELHG